MVTGVSIRAPANIAWRASNDGSWPRADIREWGVARFGEPRNSSEISRFDFQPESRPPKDRWRPLPLRKPVGQASSIGMVVLAVLVIIDVVLVDGDTAAGATADALADRCDIAA